MNAPTASLVRLARRAAAAKVPSVVSKRAAPPAVSSLLTSSRSFSAQKKEEVPPEDYYDGHLMADHLEYLDDMIEKTVKLKSSMEELKEKKMRAVEGAKTSGVKWVEAQEIDRLFEETSQHKDDIAGNLANLKTMMAEARKTYAVDAPDGYSDAWVKEEMEEIKHIIEDAAVHENKEEVLRLHKQQEENAKTFAVDAPDGETDWHQSEEMAEVKHIIDDAAVLEDKEEIERQHDIEDKIRKDRARDPEHDW